MKDKTFQTNVAFHSILLFTFLSIFFWLYITKVIVAALSDQVTGVIHKDIPMLVSELNSFVAFNRLRAMPSVSMSLSLMRRSQQFKTKSGKPNTLLVALLKQATAMM